jgi:hypothetical protein
VDQNEGDIHPPTLHDEPGNRDPGRHAHREGLTGDLATAAGLTLPHSSGPVEGNVNRIKMIKRQMYGRASFDLLRKRVLLAA